MGVAECIALALEEECDGLIGADGGDMLPSPWLVSSRD
jgi:hypothetical protein